MGAAMKSVTDTETHAEAHTGAVGATDPDADRRGGHARRSMRRSTRWRATPPTWAATARRGPGGPAGPGAARHHGGAGRLAGRPPAPPRASPPGRPKRARSSSPASAPWSAWPGSSATRCARSPSTGRPSFAGPVTEAADGRLRVRVFPATAFDRVAFPQTTAEVWMQPGVTRADLESGQAAAYADPAAHAGTSLVLAAGNVASLGPARRALQALRRGQGGRDEGQPGQRVSGARTGSGPWPPWCGPACCASSTAAPRSAGT